MYIQTLEINQKCNLECKYCYLGEKKGGKMSMSIACKAVDLAFEKVKIHKDRKLWFDFVGGEAFLDFSMIKEIIVYIEKKNLTIINFIQYSVTTNATLFTKENVDYLVKKNFSLKVSIDGNKMVNDMNRVSKAGFSVHDKIVESLMLIKDFEKRSNKIVQVTNVVTNNNYENYFNSVKYLVTELNFKLIDTGFDYFNDWSDVEKKGLEEEIKKVLFFFIECVKQEKGFRWSFADSLYEMKKERKKFYTCGAGIVSCYVRWDGRLFACPGNLSENVTLGHIDTGFEKKKIDWLRNFNDIENNHCHECEVFDYCTEKSCVMMNVAKTGSPHHPDPMLCWMRMLMYKIYLENQEIIECITM